MFEFLTYHCPSNNVKSEDTEVASQSIFIRNTNLLFVVPMRFSVFL